MAQKQNRLHQFLDWVQNGPAILTIWFVPFVMFLWVIAKIKNKLTGEK